MDSKGPSPHSQQAAPTSSRAPRLEYLDGLRGFASAMVVLHHLPVFVAVPALFGAVVSPNPWVAIFITLSGFCLYLPAAARPQVEMPRPFREFMARRARRILPAWYASLALCLLVGWFFSKAYPASAGYFLPAGPWDLPAHLTLTHSMTRFSGSINGPGYTLGTEWQLYLWMIVLVAVAARAGWAALLAAVMLLSLPMPGVVFKVWHHLFSPTFGAPFVIGMAASRLARLPRPPAAWSRWEVPALGGLLVAGVAAFTPLDRLGHDYACWAAAAATGAACVLMARRPGGLVTRALSSRGGQALGGYSYSLYLTHFPLLALAAFVAARLSLPAPAALWTVFVPALFLIFGFAYLFSLAFERPFLNTRPALPRLSGAAKTQNTAQDSVERAAVDTR